MAASMQQGQAPQASGSSGQQQPQQQQQGDLDPVTKFKILLPRLKDSLITLFKDAAQIFKTNAALDSGSLPENPPPRERFEKFEKRLEDFCGICDQIEITLRLALELHHQTVDSMKNTPLAVMISKPDPSTAQSEGQSYAQYLTTMRQQINYAKELHDLLHDAVNRLLDRAQPPPLVQPMSQPSSQQE